MPKNFVEAGGASQILAIADQGGVPLVQEQRFLTPFQRMVITLGIEKAQEEGGRKGGSARNGGMTKNSMARSRGSPMDRATGETVQYVNKGIDDGGN